MLHFDDESDCAYEKEDGEKPKGGKVIGRSIVIVAAAGLSCMACTTHRESQIMDGHGVSPRLGQNVDATRHADLVNRFIVLADRASRIGFEANSYNDDNLAVGAHSPLVIIETDHYQDAENQELIHRFLRSGFVLISANCNDYFWAMGGEQRTSRALRDSVAPIAALITGIVGLVNGGVAGATGAVSDDWLTGLSLGSTFVTASLDIYDRHFLFGAENIHSVRQLTMRALAVNALAAMYSEPSGGGAREPRILSFDEAAVLLVENQNICTPASILFLTRQTIANGAVTSVSSDTGTVLPRETDDTNPRAEGNTTAEGLQGELEDRSSQDDPSTQQPGWEIHSPTVLPPDSTLR